MAPKIFISYRRSDSRAITGRIDDYLRESFGHHHVYRDIESISIGVDFAQHIVVQEISEGGKSREVKLAHVLLAQAPGLEKVLEVEPPERPTAFKPKGFREEADGSAEATNQDGIIYDAPQLLADVARIVEEAKAALPDRGASIGR